MKSQSYPIIDLHDDYVLSCYEKGVPFGSAKQINKKLIKKGKIKVIFAGFSYDDYFGDTERQLQILLDEVASDRNGLKLIKKRQDLIDVMHSENKTGIILHLEGAKIVDKKMKVLDRFYEMGLRSISLTHSGKNQLASGNKINPKNHITPLGEAVVKEAVKKHMVVDLAHLNYAGFYDVLRLLKNQPPVVSHTCAYDLCPDPRNLKNEQIVEVAKQGGVIGVFFSAKYVKSDYKTATIDDVVRHFVHIAEVGGIDVLAFGSDFGGITTGLPKGLENISCLQKILTKLKAVGFSQEDLEKVAYKNAYRVINQILK